MNPTTIQNCWKTTKILPDLLDEEIEGGPSGNSETTAEIESMIRQLPLGEDAMTAEEFIDLPEDNETEEELTIEELVEAVTVSFPC